MSILIKPRSLGPTTITVESAISNQITLLLQVNKWAYRRHCLHLHGEQWQREWNQRRDTPTGERGGITCAKSAHVATVLTTTNTTPRSVRTGA